MLRQYVRSSQTLLDSYGHLLILCLQVTGVAVPAPGYEIVPLTVEVQAVPGGDKMSLSGSVEEIHAQLLNLNPNFDKDFPADQGKAATVDSRSLSKRFGPQCGTSLNNYGGWNFASANGIQNGINYLRGVQGKPTLGPKQCSRVSCSWDDAIWWCNDNGNSITLPGFNTIADCAQVLKNQCATGLPGVLNAVYGQNFVSVTLRSITSSY